jgi:2-polyprenyl-3-methyl-5-hydroxy-6-metoxy-1,4-benzoquinol methylase
MGWETVACDLCGSRDNRLVLQVQDTNCHFEGVFNIVQCLSCGLVYLNPRPDARSIGRYYPEDYRCFQSGKAIRRDLDKISPFISSLCQLGVKPGRILDIGCGAGDFIVSAHQSGWQVAGVEPNEPARHRCNSRLGWEAVQPTLEEAAFPAQSFQVVTLWHVLEHTNSPKETLAEVHRILAPGGLVAIAVPNFDSIDRRIHGRGWFFLAAPRHLYHFTQDTLSQYLGRAGFKVVQVFFRPRWNILPSKILSSARNFMLNWWEISTIRLPNAPDTITSGDSKPPMAEHWKKRRGHTATRITYPLAWLAAQMLMGIEIAVCARRQ